MDKSQIHLWDLHRILFGNAPVVFLFEVVVRTIVTYIALLFIVRWLGKRMSGQLTITELGITIMLGAIVAPPMETPERGILQGLMILLLVLICHQALTRRSVRHPRLEEITHGRISVFVIDGVLQLDQLKKDRISAAQVFAALRELKVYNLGKVKRLYLEAGGYFSLYEAKEDRPGLSLLPVGDPDIHSIQTTADIQVKACTYCGNTKKAPEAGENCTICGHSHWDRAII